MTNLFVIFALGAFQTAIFAILLLTKKERTTADKYIASFFFVITLYLLNNYSVKYGLWETFPEIIAVLTLISLSYGPLLFFYVSTLIGQTVRKKSIALHLLPIAGIFLLILPFLFHSHDEKLLYFTDKFINLPLHVSIGTFLQYLSAPLYFIGILLLLKKHKENIKNTRSSIDKINLDWMRKLLYGVIIILLLDGIYVYLLNFTSLELPNILSWIIKFAFILFIVLIGYYGINQGNIFSSDQKTQPTKKTPANPTHVKTNQPKNGEAQTNSLLNYMNKEKAFLNSELRIQDIAVDLDIPVHVLSHLINSKLNQNFYDFTNQYRIEEVKKRLHDPTYNQLTIVAIANDCGFHSKATFNRLFKKHTNQTPTQYKQNKVD